MNNTYICHTPYHLLITLVKTLTSKREGVDNIILCEKNNFLPETICKLKSIFKSVYSYSRQDQPIPQISWKGRIFRGLSYYEKKMEKICGLNRSFFLSSNIYIYNDTSFFGRLLNIAKIKYNLIEDGLNCFQMELYNQPSNNKNLLYQAIEKILGIYWEGLGKSKYIKEIEVNDKSGVSLSHCKIVECNRRKLFSQLTSFDCEKIADIFCYKSPTHSHQQKDSTLLITQPLAEDNLVNHEKKIEIYKTLVKDYAVGTLYIKVHPRESENWGEVFPDAIIKKKKKIPLELYTLKEHLHFKKSITAFSTAIDYIDCADEKIKKTFNWVKDFNKQTEE